MKHDHEHRHWDHRARRLSLMSGRRSRDKGNRVERGIVAALQAAGLAAVRVPLSGAAGGRFSGDVIMPLAGRDLCLEVKARADGFRNLYDWLQDRDVLIVKADRQEPLVVVRLSMAAALVAQIGRETKE
jgi:Holliday junction resolvase